MTRHLNLATALIIAIALAVCLVSPLVGMDAPTPQRGVALCPGGVCTQPAAGPQRYTEDRVRNRVGKRWFNSTRLTPEPRSSVRRGVRRTANVVIQPVRRAGQVLGRILPWRR